MAELIQIARYHWVFTPKEFFTGVVSSRISRRTFATDKTLDELDFSKFTPTSDLPNIESRGGSWNSETLEKVLNLRNTEIREKLKSSSKARLVVLLTREKVLGQEAWETSDPYYSLWVVNTKRINHLDFSPKETKHGQAQEDQLFWELGLGGVSANGADLDLHPVGATHYGANSDCLCYAADVLYLDARQYEWRNTTTVGVKLTLSRLAGLIQRRIGRASNSEYSFSDEKTDYKSQVKRYLVSKDANVHALPPRP